MRLRYFDIGVVIFLMFLVWGENILKGNCVSRIIGFKDHQNETITSSNEIMSPDRTFLVWDDMKVDLVINGSKKNSSSKVIVVDRNGRGDSVTVQAAINMVPYNNRFRYKIHIRPGIYREKVNVPKSKPYISFIGDEGKATETVITWHDKASDRMEKGKLIGTFGSASVSVESDYFCAKDVTFENTIVAVAGSDGMQAVALRLSGDKAWLHRVRILGTQDTLLDEKGLHFYDQCFIQGSIDFICGNGKSLFQHCTLNSVANGVGAIAAHKRESWSEDTGFSFVNCHVTGTGRILLGRAWGSYSRILYSYCHFNNIIDPKGWDDWQNHKRDKTVEFGEFQCRGKGANRRNRVPWAKSYRFLEAEYSLTTDFINGRRWLDPFTNSRFINARR